MSRIKSIQIKEFRGFFENQVVNFAIPNGTVSSGLTVIVGPNNSGKTTIIEAIRKFYSSATPQFEKEERHIGKNVEITITNTENETKSLVTSGSAVAQLVGNEIYPTGSNFF